MRVKIVLGALALASLSGCGSTGLFDRERPDEFAVTKAAPLAVPADLSTLPAPQPGTVRQTSDTKKEMLDAMFGAPKQ
jgi:uncharacterized lipoprotein